MQPKFKIDTREFQKVLLQYKNAGKKIFADVLNIKAYFIARGAIRLTPRADYKKFTAELGVKTRTVTKGKRKGRPTMN